MDLSDFEYNGGHAYVVGLHFCFPPKYATFSLSKGWTWTNELTKAETFSTKEVARAHKEGEGMASLIDGNEDVMILKVEMKVGLA